MINTDIDSHIYVLMICDLYWVILRGVGSRGAPGAGVPPLSQVELCMHVSVIVISPTEMISEDLKQESATVLPHLKSSSYPTALLSAPTTEQEVH